MEAIVEVETRRVLTPAERLARRLGGLERAARYDSVEMTAAARKASSDRFLDLVDPERRLSEPDRLRRAEAARRAHFTRMALKSVQARSRKARVAGVPTSPTTSEEANGGTSTATSGT